LLSGFSCLIFSQRSTHFLTGSGGFRGRISDSS
jgi:hypothetical protein